MSARIGSTPRPAIGAKSPIFIRPITVHSSDSSCPSLLLSFDQSRYLFNCPENTSRAFVQARVPQKNLASIFLSSCRTSYAGGTYGMLMGLADGKRDNVRLIGPDGLRYMIACGRLFTRRQGTKVDIAEFRPQRALELVFQDNHLRVYAIGYGDKDCKLLGQERTPDSQDSQSTAFSPRKRAKLTVESRTSPNEPPDSAKSSDRLHQIINDMFRPEEAARPPGPNTPAYSYQRLPAPIEPWNTDPVSYLIVGPRLRGKFLPEKAKKLGIKPGPDFAKLVSGEKVQAGDGRWIESEMCVEGGSSGSAFFISNVASIEQLERASLAEPESILGVSDGAQLVVIYHFVHEDVLLDPRYIEWMGKFKSHVKHYISTPSHCPDLYTFEPAAVLQLKLNIIAPSLFSLPYYCSTPVLSCPSDTMNILTRSDIFWVNSPKASEPDAASLNYKLLSQDMTEVDLISELKLKTGFRDILAKVRMLVELRRKESPANCTTAHEIMVTTLGTGSAAPSKYRNVSSTLLHIPRDNGPEYDYILLDAGEGTLGQIRRKFGSHWVEVLKNLKIVFISHMHADHHCGLVYLLAERLRLSECKPLGLVCQYGIYLYLTERSRIEALGIPLGGVQWFNSEDFLKSSSARLQALKRLEEHVPCGFELETIRVAHWGKCYGVCIEHRLQNWKIVFSGDTKPNEALIEAGQGADLLIHEATLGPDEIQLAETKGHSTIDQAIKVGLRMKAKNCLLNHFSGRYPKIPPSVDPSNNQQMKIGISFDLMSCKISQTGELQDCLPALEHVVEAQEKEDFNEEAERQKCPRKNLITEKSKGKEKKNKKVQGLNAEVPKSGTS